MTTTQWVLSLIAALLGGGAMGAGITAFITYYRNRRQPIGYKIETIEVFKQNPDIPLLKALLTVGGPGSLGVGIENLSVARITIINKGNQDIAEFNFGVTLKGTCKAVDVKVETPDRHHELEVNTLFSYDLPVQEVDFKAQPLNRKEPYVINVHYIYVDTPSPIRLGSSHPARFVELSSSDSLPEQRHSFVIYLLVAMVSGLFLSTLTYFIQKMFSLK